jgi:O-succinylbenzoic acid--CoA ligase
MEYPYPTLWINGRDVLISDILTEKEIPRDIFEQHTFSFTKTWLSEAHSFELKTSGSTGNPKTIFFSRDQMIASARMTQAAIGLTQGDTALLCLSPEYVAGKMMLVRCFVTGMKIRAVTPTATIPDALPEELVHFAAMVPAQVHEICRSNKKDRLNRFKTILIGGAALDDDTLEILQSVQCRFLGTYGMTETLSHIALRNLNGPTRSDGYTCLPGVVIALDERGCLEIQAAHVHGKVVTNDLVEIITPETFRWIGRFDNVINSGGVKIIPEVLERKLIGILHEVNIVANIIVAGIPDVKLGQKVVLLLEGSPLPDTKKQHLQEKFLEGLSKYEAPKQFFFIPKFILTNTGKVNRPKTVELVKNLTRH